MLDLSLRTLHVAAVVTYLGGGILFHGSLRRALRLIPPGQASIIGTRVGGDFTYLSWLSLALWGITGYWMLFRYGWGEGSAPLTLFLNPDTLATSRGLSLLVMLVVWYLILINASVITFVLRPRLALRLSAAARAEAADQMLATISNANRWVDVLALVNILLSFVGLLSGALFL